jgi:hypothetical protein
MIEMVVALCLFLNDKMIEHSHKESLSECLETKRKIERNTNSGNSHVKCEVVKAKVYVDKHGIKRIEEIKKH